MTHANARGGFTLVELLVTVVLLLVLLAVASLSTQRVLAVQVREGTTDARRTALTDALHTLERQVAAADPLAGDLRVLPDSVLEVVHDIGITTVCRAHGDTLVVTSGSDTVPWAATLPRAITTDDRLRVWHDTEERWVPRQVLAAATTGGACGDSSLAWPAVGSQRLVLDSATTGLHPGVVVRVLQQERWSMVRGADGSWSLAQATWDVARQQYTTPQPLLSPLTAPGSRFGPGLSVRALDAQGRPLPDSLRTLTRAVQVTLRMATSPRLRTITDSVRINVGPR